MTHDILGQWSQWRDKLILELRMKDVPGSVVGEILAEVEAHLQESGETPETAFGDARTYARQRAANVGGVPDGTGPSQSPHTLPTWITWGLDDWPLRDMVLIATCSLGGVLAGFGARELGAGGDSAVGIAPWLTLILGGVLCFLPLIVLPTDAIIDPRSGKGAFISRFAGRGMMAALWTVLLVLSFVLGWFSTG